MRSPVTWIKRFGTFYKCVVWGCVLALAIGLAGCSDRPTSKRPTSLSSSVSKRFAKEIIEVSPPASIQALRKELDGYQPQVKILSPRPGDILDDTDVSVRFQVNDLPLFKDDASGLGPHLHVILDNQPYQAVFDPSEPLVFRDLAPGSHTIRAFASRPWHESFKNAGAYAQVSFDIFTDTANSAPADDQPVLTYSRPKGSYGAEPIMLDFYLADAPLHVLARESEDDDIEDWQIRGTVNGQSFTFDTWEPIYLKGFVPGLNWVKLELIDTNGNVIDGPFNSTARLIEYAPGGDDALSKLIRGELSTDEMMQIVDPDYEPQPAVEEPVSEPVDEDTPEAPELTEPELTAPAINTETDIDRPNATEPADLRRPDASPADTTEETGLTKATDDRPVTDEAPDEIQPTDSDSITLDESSADEAATDEGDRQPSESVQKEKETAEEDTSAIAPATSSPDTPTEANKAPLDDQPTPIDPDVEPNVELDIEPTPDASEPITVEEEDMNVDKSLKFDGDSPIEKGVDVMPSDFDDSDEEMATIANPETESDSSSMAAPSSQPPLMQPILRSQNVLQI
jgi:hypothetical protein